MITIVDYGLGNLGSIKNMLKKIGSDSIITSDIELISQAEKLILPGVGSFDSGMNHLTESGLDVVLNQKVIIEKTPILGICLGMQLMTKSSEEGELPGLGWVDAKTIKFSPDIANRKQTIPHMGWEYVYAQKESKVLKDMYLDPKFYFVHSYYVTCEKEQDVLLKSEYLVDYVAGFEKENILAMQFHPEKSHKFGMKLLKNFVENY